ncbi:hypothetical protein [Pontibacter harenae]|nr:hypothetical protein [Pontibacter harenae]
MLNFRYYSEVSGDDKYSSFGPTLGIGVQAYLLRKKAKVIKVGL